MALTGKFLLETHKTNKKKTETFESKNKATGIKASVGYIGTLCHHLHKKAN